MFNQIASTPAAPGEKPCFKGTRSNVKSIVELAASGASRDDILRANPHLTAADIEEVLQYAGAFLKKEDWETVELFRLIDCMMELPRDLEIEFREKVMRYVEETQVP